MKKNRVLKSVAAGALVLVVMGANSVTAFGTTTSAPSYKTITLWDGFTGIQNNNSLVQKLFRKTLGLQVNINYTEGVPSTALNLALSSGGFQEDAAVWPLDPTSEDAFARSGDVLALNKYFNMPKQYPNLAKIPKEYLNFAKSANGNIYYIPTWWAQQPDAPWPGWMSNAWWVRTDVLKKVGMTVKDLSTLSGVQIYLEKVAKLKNASGQPMLPMGFIAADEQIILNSFGVDTATASGGLVPVSKVGSHYVFEYDQPGYKKAFQWMNEMYRKGLIDPEVVTQSVTRFQEKNAAGDYGLEAASMWNLPNSGWESLSGPTSPYWYLKPIPYPLAPGVKRPGNNAIIDPFPGYGVYINKNSPNVGAILSFLNWTLGQTPYRQQDVNEGPEGTNWYWINKKTGDWTFRPAYAKLRNGETNTIKAEATPQMYYLSSYSNAWYPWWTNSEVGDPAGGNFTRVDSQEISKMGVDRTIKPYDLVTAQKNSLWDQYGLTLQQVVSEYDAQLIMATSNQQFESTWQQFRTQLQDQAHWSALKQEWLQELPKTLKEYRNM